MLPALRHVALCFWPAQLGLLHLLLPSAIELGPSRSGSSFFAEAARPGDGDATRAAAAPSVKVAHMQAAALQPGGAFVQRLRKRHGQRRQEKASSSRGGRTSRSPRDTPERDSHFEQDFEGDFDDFEEPLPQTGSHEIRDGDTVSRGDVNISVDNHHSNAFSARDLAKLDQVEHAPAPSLASSRSEDSEIGSTDEVDFEDTSHETPLHDGESHETPLHDGETVQRDGQTIEVENHSGTGFSRDEHHVEDTDMDTVPSDLRPGHGDIDREVGRPSTAGHENLVQDPFGDMSFDFPPELPHSGLSSSPAPGHEELANPMESHEAIVPVPAPATAALFGHRPTETPRPQRRSPIPEIILDSELPHDEHQLFKTTDAQTMAMKTAALRADEMVTSVDEALNHLDKKMVGYDTAIKGLTRNFGNLNYTAKDLHGVVLHEFKAREDARMCAFKNLQNYLDGKPPVPCEPDDLLLGDARMLPTSVQSSSHGVDTAVEHTPVERSPSQDAMRSESVNEFSNTLPLSAPSPGVTLQSMEHSGSRLDPEAHVGHLGSSESIVSHEPFANAPLGHPGSSESIVSHEHEHEHEEPFANAHLGHAGSSESIDSHEHVPFANAQLGHPGSSESIVSHEHEHELHEPFANAELGVPGSSESIVSHEHEHGHEPFANAQLGHPGSSEPIELDSHEHEHEPFANVPSRPGLDQTLGHGVGHESQSHLDTPETSPTQNQVGGLGGPPLAWNPRSLESQSLESPHHGHGPPFQFGRMDSEDEFDEGPPQRT